jgi:hypothetical protein
MVGADSLMVGADSLMAVAECLGGLPGDGRGGSPDDQMPVTLTLFSTLYNFTRYVKNGIMQG